MNYGSRLQKKFGTLGEYFLLMDSRTIVIFTDFRTPDYLIKSKHSFFVNKPMLFHKDEPINISQQQLSNLIDKCNRIFNGTVQESFSLPVSYIPVIKDTIEVNKATHIRFFTEDNEIKLSIFNYRKFVDEITPVLVRNLGISSTVIKNEIPSIDFSVTFDSTSFSHLPIDTYQVEILSNDICSFISMDSNHEYFFMNQGIQEPLIKFVNDRHNCDMFLMYLPNSYSPLEDTNQLLD